MNILNTWEFWTIAYLVSAVVFAYNFKIANKNMKDAGSLTILLEVFTGIFFKILSEDKFTEGQIDILSVLVASGLCSSRNEARRAVEQGGVSVNDEKVADIKTAYVPSDFADGLILKRGKKSFRRVIM